MKNIDGKNKQVKKSKTKSKTEAKTEKRIIHLHTEIEDQQAENIVKDLLKMDNAKSKGDITIYINSPGGKVSAGLAIYDAMQMIKSDIRTICIGRCASMASVLLSGGTKGKRFITSNSEVMIHEVSTLTAGKLGEVKVNFEHTSKVNERLIKLLVENTGQSLKQITKDTLKDKWFNADEAIKYGLVDKILTKENIKELLK